MLLAPLWLNDEILGCLEVVWDPPRDITNGDEQLLETIATQVAIAIANAQLYTERQRAEAALRHSERRLQRMVEHLPAGAVHRERDNVFFNKAVEQLTGYSHTEVETIDQWFSCLYGMEADQIRQRYEEDRRANFPAPRIVPLTRKNGEVRFVEFAGYRAESSEVWLLYDVTKRRHAERALQESEERYRIVSQCISDYAFSFRVEDGKDAFLEWLTDSFTRVTGYPISDFLGKSNPWAHYIHPQDLEGVNAAVRQMQPGVPTTYEFRIIRRDGETRWIRSYAYAVRGEKGSVTRLYGAAQDITERKHAEDMLHYQRAFEQLVATISKDFLNRAPEEIDQGVLRALHMVGEFSRVDRSYVFLFHEDLATMDNTYEWCAPGIAPMQSQLRNIPTNTLPWLMRILKDLEVVHIPEVSTLPAEAQAENQHFRLKGFNP